MNRNLRMLLGGATAAAVVLGAAACSSSNTASTGGSTTTAAPATTAAKGTVAVANQWARQSPAVANAGAVYMDLTSTGGDKLLAASVPTSVAAKAELHETTVETGSTGTTMKAGGDMGGTTATTAKASKMSAGAVAEPVAYQHEGEADEGTTDSTTKSTGTTSKAMPGDDMSGAMVMKPVSSIDLPAGKTVQLKPGGYHIMLLELAQPLKVGQTIEVTLTFEKAGKQTVQVPVREG